MLQLRSYGLQSEPTSCAASIRMAGEEYLVAWTSWRAALEIWNAYNCSMYYVSLGKLPCQHSLLGHDHVPSWISILIPSIQ